MFRNRQTVLCVIVFVLAFALRFSHLLELRQTVYFENLLLDAERYDEVAVRLADGRGFDEPVFTMTPLYPACLAVLYRLAGRSLFLVRLVQVFIGAAGCVLLCELARRWFGFGAAVGCGILAAAYRPFIAYDNILMAAGLSVFCMILSLFLLQFAAESKRTPIWFFAGLALGLGVVLRPNLLLFVPFCLGWTVCQERKLWWKPAAALGAGLLLPILPVTARNVLHGGDYVLVTASGGMNFYIGNSDEADGTFLPPGGEVGHPTVLMVYSHRQAESELGRSLKASEVSGHWYGKTFRSIGARPFHWLGLLLRKAFLFWAPKEWPSSYNIDFMRGRLGLLGLPLVGFGLVVPLALLGMALSISRWREAYWGYAVVFSFWLALTLYFVLAHYRLPAVSAMLPFAGLATAELVERARAREWHRLAKLLAPLVTVAIVLHLPRFDDTAFKTVAHLNLGSIYQKTSNHRAAIKEFRSVTNSTPADGLAWSRLGLSLAAVECSEDGRVALEKGIQLLPRSPEVYNNLGIYYGNCGEASRAAQCFRQALAVDPEFSEARYNLQQAMSRSTQESEP